MVYTVTETWKALGQNSDCELHLTLLTEGTEKTIARLVPHNMFYSITNKNTTSGLATMSRVMTSWFILHLPVADFFQGHIHRRVEWGNGKHQHLLIL